MSDDDRNRRQHPRYEADWRIKLRCADWRAAHRVAAADVSRGGLFITTARPPAVGARVEVAVDLPDDMRLVLQGECVHVRTAEQSLRTGRPPGFGVRVDESHATDLMVLEEMARAALEKAAPPPALGPAPGGTPHRPRPQPERPDEDGFDDDTPTGEQPRRRTAPEPEDPDESTPTRRRPPRRSPALSPTPAAGGEDDLAAGSPAPDLSAVPPAPAPGAAAPRDDREPASVRPRPEPPGDRLAAGGPPESTPPAAARPAGSQPGSAAATDGQPPAATATSQDRPVTAPPAPRPSPRPLRGAAKAVGIDFGTTFTRVAVQTVDGPVLLADEDGRELLPSIIAYPEGGGCLVGWPARELLTEEPQRAIASAKRLLGRSYDHPEIQGLLASYAFGSERGPNDQPLFRIGEQPLAVPQVCAAIIRHANEIAEQRLGTRVRKAVLSMPVTFGEEQQAALKRAAMLAGVEVLELIPEPVAGAVTYSFERSANDIVAVYDFGGGTFDFTLLDVSGDSYQVLGSSGDSWLGGDDFDLALAQWAADQFWHQTKVELRQRVLEWQRLLLASEEAKRRLTDTPETVIELPRVVLAPHPTDLRVAITRDTLLDLVGDLVARSLEVCHEAFEHAGLEPRDVGQVVLSGGTTNMPLVQHEVSRFFDRELAQVVSPDIAIAQGAAIRAARLMGEPAG